MGICIIVQLMDLMLIIIHMALFMAALLEYSNWYLRIWDLVLHETPALNFEYKQEMSR